MSRIMELLLVSVLSFAAHRILAERLPYFRGPMFYSPYAENFIRRCTADNEVFKMCSGCEPTCAELHPPCPLRCTKPKCECRIGYVRHNGVCIRHTECPTESPVVEQITAVM